MNFSYLISDGIELKYVQLDSQIIPLKHFVNLGKILWNLNSQTSSLIFFLPEFIKEESQMKGEAPSPSFLTAIAALVLEAKPTALFGV